MQDKHEVLGLLLHHKADLSECDKNGRQPLHVAVAKGHLATTKFLLGVCDFLIRSLSACGGHSTPTLYFCMSLLDIVATHRTKCTDENRRQEEEKRVSLGCTLGQCRDVPIHFRVS